MQNPKGLNLVKKIRLNLEKVNYCNKLITNLEVYGKLIKELRKRTM